ncbi:Rogdi leucine zipper containing protein-domain-containing protein [Annulohypoxylon truncatum]|uniref:Rogdi leucine zipper containing protein-domain-containing protein n=1 Tax=Annulohypoxylon truncatum TaxID=327061 RepID=UPI00200888DC|nr:Rogdi leucine zipper containing protein-domain-containing protein [Annulohypoxylon truncatum]KAI1204895.1 Rogdi leucine zipper containing protein-domain-containing protein [Annulohypoxylon truncatum]
MLLVEDGTFTVEDNFVLVPRPITLTLPLARIHPPSPIPNPTSPLTPKLKLNSSSQPPPQARELTWLLTSLRATLSQLKQGLEDCCSLLSPSDNDTSSGSTLVLTTPRNETVKGHTTRVGTRLVRGLIHLKLRTVPPQTLVLDPARPVRVAALARLDALLASSVGLCLGLEEHAEQPSAPYLAAQLRLLALHVAEAAALVKGPAHPHPHPSPSPSPRSRPPSNTGRPTTPRPSSSASSPRLSAEQQKQHLQQQQQQQQQPPDTSWTTSSISLSHFTPPLSRNLSVYLTVQDASLVLYLRALEPADAPVNFGTKLALAIGTTRRLEHDEADRVFTYRCDDSTALDEGGEAQSQSQSQVEGRKGVEVYVREKVCVESADPSLLSLSAKLTALGNTLGLARRNLAAVMGEEVED